ncbi:glycoside hydrolase family 31 protein [Bacillus solitudinis]|uniref:glycoside hydrolase family 31 protein n=1 Tax=Bacillus solitudinis TaxID=2014074 RepID=UPI000C239554|nr:TIM-barrel domain-containing protein [Bacillus solitudinis]
MKKFKKSIFAVAMVTALVSTSIAPYSALAVDKPHPDIPLEKDNLEQLVVQTIEQTETGLKLDLGSEYEGYINLLDDDIAQVSIVEDGEEVKDSPGIAKKNWKTPNFKATDEGQTFKLETDEITVVINKEPYGVKMLDKEGNVINEDYSEFGSSAGYEDGKPYVFRETTDDEAFYGFGEQTGLELNKRGKSMGMWNTDNYAYSKESKYVYVSIPFFMGLKDEKAYGIFFDNTHRSYYEMASESDDYYYFYADGGQLNYYFIYGPEISDVVDQYTEITGKYYLPAEWTMGLHQSKWEYTADEIVEVAQTYRDKNIPLDVMHFDIDYMQEYRLFTWTEDYKQALDKLKSMEGFHAIAINDPAVKKEEGYFMYDEGTENDYWAKNADGTPFVGPVWPGDSMFPDFSKEEVRDWWADKHSILFDAGIDGIWNDMNEPAVFEAESYWTMPLDAYFGTEDNKILHEEYHNLFGHDEAEATYKAFEMHKPDERPFVLTRDMYAGSQRYSALWTGDNVSNWEHLEMTLPMNMNIGLSGVPMVGGDIGGFAGRPNGELFARWIQIGAFSPFARIHYDSDSKADFKQGQEPWAFGPEVEDISRKYIEMRYQLMPYLYNAMQEATETGKPVQQPLVYHFQDDENTYDIHKQFMFGDSIMVAPVLEEGATSVEAYLPKGETWIDFWTGEEYEGNQTITVQAELDHLPIFVKQDSIIPTREVQQYTGEKPLENLVLDTYLDDQATYSFYEDDANSQDYKNGEYNVTNFTVNKQNKNIVTFEQQKEVQNYKDTKLKSYTLKLNNTEKPSKVQAASSKYKAVNSEEAVKETTETYFYNEEENTLYVNIPADEKQKVQVFFNGNDR